MTAAFERLVCSDWQSGRLRWTAAVAALRLAGLPALYALAYRRGVSIERRFADEVRLPDLARRHELTSPVWRANPAWQPVWYRDIDRQARTTLGYGTGPGHAQRWTDALDRGVWWLVREQHAVEWNRWEWDRMQEASADNRRRLRRIRHRVMWLQMTFDPVPDDLCLAIVNLWASGGTSTPMAAEILDVAVTELRELANRLGIEITRPD